MSNPEVSCIVISCRQHEVVAECLAQCHRYPSVEVIYCNNGGNAPIPHESLADICVSTEANEGAYRARNVAADYASGRYLVFVDDDGVPSDRMIHAHIDGHKRYDIVSSQGCCLPRTRTLWNYQAYHYRLGAHPCPYVTNLEGNCCVRADIFRAVNGWNGAIVFGGGGVDLSLRILSYIGGDHRRFAYLPDAILYHDYCRGSEHLRNKAIRQRESMAIRIREHPDYDYHRRVWKAMVGRPELLIPRRQHAQAT